MTKTKRLEIRIADETLAKLAKLSESLSRNASDTVRFLIDQAADSLRRAKPKRKSA